MQNMQFYYNYIANEMK